MIFNNNCTGVHVIDAIEGVYVSDANAPESNNRQLYRNLAEVDQKIVELLVSDKFITTTQMAIQTGKSRQTVATRIKAQQEWGVVKRKEPDKGGFWGILQ